MKVRLQLVKRGSSQQIDSVTTLLPIASDLAAPWCGQASAILPPGVLKMNLTTWLCNFDLSSGSPFTNVVTNLGVNADCAGPYGEGNRQNNIGAYEQ